MSNESPPFVAPPVRAVNLKLPPFWANDPTIWFALTCHLEEERGCRWTHSNMQGARVGIIGNLGRLHTNVLSLAVFTVRPFHSQEMPQVSLTTNDQVAYLSSVDRNTGTRFFLLTLELRSAFYPRRLWTNVNHLHLLSKL